jgi:chlorophyll/bacteriochlorophyll a synthase
MAIHTKRNTMILLSLIPAAGAFQGAAFGPSRAIAARSSAQRLSMLPGDKLPSSFYPFDQQQLTSEMPVSAPPPRTPTSLRASSDGPNKQASDGSGNVRQLLGLKGAATETDIWKIRLQLTKPVTWIPLVWGVMCGAAASGNYHWIWNPFDEADRDVMLGLEDAAKGFVAMVLAGPFLTGSLHLSVFVPGPVRRPDARHTFPPHRQCRFHPNHQRLVR